MGPEPVCVSAVCRWLEEGLGKNRGYLGPAVCAGILGLCGRPWIHSAARSGGLLCTIRYHALLLHVYSQHGTPQHPSDPQPHQRAFLPASAQPSQQNETDWPTAPPTGQG